MTPPRPHEHRRVVDDGLEAWLLGGLRPSRIRPGEGTAWEGMAPQRLVMAEAGEVSEGIPGCFDSHFGGRGADEAVEQDEIGETRSMPTFANSES